MPEDTFGNLSKQHIAAQDRAHKSSERAAQQFVKLLGAVLGGFGVAIAAWLQRIFEHPAPPSPLAWYLVYALFFVGLGLAALALTAIIDQHSSHHASKSVQLNMTLFLHARQRWNIGRSLRLSDDEKSTRTLAILQEDQDLGLQRKQADASAERLNAFSVWFGFGSWACLVAAFASLGIGIVKTLESLC
jgi:hypothetical protein